MNNELLEGPAMIRSEVPEGSWTDEDARRLLQPAYTQAPPDPALMARVERQVLDYAADGPLRQQRTRLVGLLALILAAYLMMLLGFAWLGQLWGAPMHQEWYVASPSVSQAGR